MTEFQRFSVSERYPWESCFPKRNNFSREKKKEEKQKILQLKIFKYLQVVSVIEYFLCVTRALLSLNRVQISTR